MLATVTLVILFALLLARPGKNIAEHDVERFAGLTTGGYVVGDILTVPTGNGVTVSPKFTVSAVTAAGGVASVSVLTPGAFTGSNLTVPTTATKSDGVTPSGGVGCRLTLGVAAGTGSITNFTGANNSSAGSNAIVANDPGAWAARAGVPSPATPLHLYANATAGNYTEFHFSSGAGTMTSTVTPNLPIAAQAIGTGTNATNGSGATFYLAPSTNQTSSASFNAGNPGSTNLQATGVGGAQVATGGTGYTAADVGKVLTVCQGIGNPNVTLTGAPLTSTAMTGVTPATLTITSVSGGAVTGVAVASPGSYKSRVPLSGGALANAAAGTYVINPALTSPYFTGSSTSSAKANGLMLSPSYYIISGAGAPTVAAGGSGYGTSGTTPTASLVVSNAGSNAIVANDPGAWVARAGAPSTATPLHLYANSSAGNYTQFHFSSGAGTMTSTLTPNLPIPAQAIGTGTNATSGSGATFYLTPSTNQTPLSSFSYGTPGATNLQATGVGGAQVAAGGTGYTASDVGKVLTVCQGIGNPNVTQSGTSLTSTAMSGVTPATLVITSVNGGAVTGVAVASPGTYASRVPLSGGAISTTAGTYIINPALTNACFTGSSTSTAQANGLMFSNSYYMVSGTGAPTVVAGGSGYPFTGSSGGTVTWAATCPSGTNSVTSGDPAAFGARYVGTGGALATVTSPQQNSTMHTSVNSTGGNFTGWHYSSGSPINSAFPTPYLPMTVQAIGATTGSGALFMLTPNTNTQPLSNFSYASPAAAHLSATSIGGLQIYSGGSGYTQADVGTILTVCQGTGSPFTTTSGSGTSSANSATKATIQITQVNNGAGTGPITGAVLATPGAYAVRTMQYNTGLAINPATYVVSPALASPQSTGSTSVASALPNKGLLIMQGYYYPYAAGAVTIAAVGSGYTNGSTAYALGGTLDPGGNPLKLVLNATNLSAALTATATTVSVLNGSGISNGDVLKIGSEQLLVTAGGGTNSLTVTRGYNSTTAAAAVIYAIVTDISQTALNSIAVANGAPVTNNISSTYNATLNCYNVLPTMPLSVSGGTGTGATFNCTPNDSITTTTGIAIATVVTGGSGYAVGNVLTIQPPTGVSTVGTAAQLTVTAVNSSGAITSVQVTNQGAYTAFNPAKCFQIATSNGGSGAILYSNSMVTTLTAACNDSNYPDCGIFCSGGYCVGDVFTLGGSASTYWSTIPQFQVVSYTYASPPTMTVQLANTPVLIGSAPPNNTTFPTISGTGWMATGATMTYGASGGTPSTIAATAVGGTIAPGASPFTCTLTVASGGIVTAVTGTNNAAASTEAPTGTNYYNVLPTIPASTTGGAGSGATFNLTPNEANASPSGIALATIVTGGTGYNLGDTLTVVSPAGSATTGTAATLVVTQVGAGGVITGINVASPGSYTANNPATLFTVAPASGGGSGCILSWGAVCSGSASNGSGESTCDCQTVAAGGYSIGDVLTLTTPAAGSSWSGSWTVAPQLQVVSYTYGITAQMTMQLLNTPSYTGSAPTAGTVFNTTTGSTLRASGAQIMWTGVGTPSAGSTVPWGGGVGVTATALGGTIAPGAAPFQCSLSVNSFGAVTGVTGTNSAAASTEAPTGTNYYNVLPTIPVTTTGGNGSGATFNLTPNEANSGATGIAIATIVTGGAGYSVGDQLTVVSPAGSATTGTAATLIVTATSGGVITGTNVLNPGSYTANNPAMLFTVVPTTGSGSGCILCWNAVCAGSASNGSGESTCDCQTVTAGGYSIGDVVTVSTATGWTGTWTVAPQLQVVSYTYNTTASITWQLINNPTYTGTGPTGAMVFNTVSGNSLMAAGATVTLAGTGISIAVAGGPPTTISPNSGPLSGGTSVTISGFGFTGATAVSFGSTAATSFTIVSDTTITAVAPPSTAAGPVDVIVTSPTGSTNITIGDQFTYYLTFNYQWTTWNSLNWSTPAGTTISWNSQAIPAAFAIQNGFYSWYAPANAVTVNPQTGAISASSYGLAAAPYPWAGYSSAVPPQPISGSSLVINIASSSPGMDGPYANNDPSGNTGSIISGDWKDFATGQLSYYGPYSNANAWQNPVFWSYYNLLVSSNPPQLPTTYSIMATTTTVTNSAGYQYVLNADGIPSSPLGRTSYVGNSGMYYFNNDPSNTGNAKYTNGPFFQDSRTKLTDITDGSSNTLLFGESLGGPDNALPTYQLTWMGSGTMPTYWDCQSPSQYFMFSSMHPGVVNFAFCDGSVRSVSKITASNPPDSMGTLSGTAPGDGTNTNSDTARPPAASNPATPRWIAFQELGGINDNSSPDLTQLGLIP
jgi:prepilin-type processing-associated H-X9-DG protein